MVRDDVDRRGEAGVLGGVVVVAAGARTHPRRGAVGRLFEEGGTAHVRGVGGDVGEGGRVEDRTQPARERSRRCAGDILQHGERTGEEAAQVAELLRVVHEHVERRVPRCGGRAASLLDRAP